MSEAQEWKATVYTKRSDKTNVFKKGLLPIPDLIRRGESFGLMICLNSKEISRAKIGPTMAINRDKLNMKRVVNEEKI